jgi:hypothetical protein
MPTLTHTHAHKTHTHTHIHRFTRRPQLQGPPPPLHRGPPLLTTPLVSPQPLPPETFLTITPQQPMPPPTRRARCNSHNSLPATLSYRRKPRPHHPHTYTPGQISHPPSPHRSPPLPSLCRGDQGTSSSCVSQPQDNSGLAASKSPLSCLMCGRQWRADSLYPG